LPRTAFPVELVVGQDSVARSCKFEREKMVARRPGEAKRASPFGKLLRNEKWEVKEKTGDSGRKICKVPHTPVFCVKSAQTTETKGVDLPRSAKERGKSAEAIETS